MDTLQRWRHRPWTVPIGSGALILASFFMARVLGSDAVSNVFMVAAAVVAGAPIAVKAVRALMVRAISIDLLVSVAAVGAVIIGEYWEAAAVTFLFTVGHALEARTMNRTRSALAELVAVAPDVAVVLRDGEQVEVPAGAVVRGETVLVKNGAKVPVDGEVVHGTGALDEASITGESIPPRRPRATGSTPAPSRAAGSSRCAPPASAPTPPSPASSTASRRPRTRGRGPRPSSTGSPPGTRPASCCSRSRSAWSPATSSWR